MTVRDFFLSSLGKSESCERVLVEATRVAEANRRKGMILFRLFVLVK